MSDLPGVPGPASGTAYLQALLEIVRAINAEAQVIREYFGDVGGDLTGSLPDPGVSRINGAALGATTATAGNLLIGQGAQWLTRPITGDATMAANGELTVSGSGGVAFGTAAFDDATVDDTAGVAAQTAGTWVPALLIAGSAVGITYGAQAGAYTRIGREVFAYFTLTLTSKGAGVGAVTIAGLPVVSNAASSLAGAGGLVASYANMAGLTGVPVIQVGASSNLINLLSSGAAASAALTDANILNTSVISGHFRYFA